MFAVQQLLQFLQLILSSLALVRAKVGPLGLVPKLVTETLARLVPVNTTATPLLMLSILPTSAPVSS